MVASPYHGWLSRSAEASDDPSAEDDPLAVFEQRYAAGDFSEAEFERGLEQLLEGEVE